MSRARGSLLLTTSVGVKNIGTPSSSAIIKVDVRVAIGSLLSKLL